MKDYAGNDTKFLKIIFDFNRNASVTFFREDSNEKILFWKKPWFSKKATNAPRNAPEITEASSLNIF